MKLADYVIKFFVFYVFFGLFSIPLFFAIKWIPSKPTWVGYIDAGVGLLLWVSLFVLAPISAHLAARKNAYEYESMSSSAMFVFSRARFYLSFVPVVGAFFAPPLGQDNERPIEPG